MSTQPNKELLEKYLEASGSRLEESEFLDGLSENAPLKDWVKFTKSQRVKPKADLGLLLDEAIDGGKTKKRGLFLKLSGIAAGLVLAFLWFSSPKNTMEMTLSEKEAALKEAMDLFSEDQETTDMVLYEDELIVIYIETQNTNK